MSYKVVQKQSNGRYYLYEVTGVWDPVKKNSKQTRTYLGVCDAEGNLLKEPARNRTVSRSPVYGPYQPEILGICRYVNPNFLTLRA